jgi:hypothetical protein
MYIRLLPPVLQHQGQPPATTISAASREAGLGTQVERTIFVEMRTGYSDL